MKKDILCSPSEFWTYAQKYIHHYLPDIQKASSNTVTAYRAGLNAFISYMEGEKGSRRQDICFSLLSKENIKDFQDWLLNERCLAPKTCNLRLTAIRSFLEYACGENADLTGLYVVAKDIKDSEVHQNPIEFFEKSQMRVILNAPDTRTKTGRRNQMMLILLYDTGARVSELLELDVKDVHMDAEVPYVTLHGKGGKYRNVPLMKKTCLHLKSYLKSFHESNAKDEPLFYAKSHGRRHHLSHDTMEDLIKSCSNKAASGGIEMPASCHCHMIRKTRAMDLYQSGVPLAHIQQLLGHENMSTTSGFYAFATLETLAKSMAKAESTQDEEKRWKDPKVIAKLYTL